MFETDGPFIWPVIHFVDNIADIFLFNAVLLFNRFWVCVKVIVNLFVFSYWKTVAGRIADILAFLRPILRNAERARRKSTFKVTANDYIQV